MASKTQPVFTVVEALRPDTSGHSLTVKVRRWRLPLGPLGLHGCTLMGRGSLLPLHRWSMPRS